MKILLIDDDRELGVMLTEYLAGEGIVATVCHTAGSGIAAAAHGGFAAVILDIMLPDASGLDALRILRTKSRIPIIMLTARGDDVDRVLGLEMGADDYVPKPFSPRELVARIKAVLRRAGNPAPVSDAPLAVGDIRLFPGPRRVEIRGLPLDLTATEFNILEILLRAGERVVSKDELSIAVLGRERQPYDRSIDVHVSNLRQKLGASGSAAGAIETVRGVGYRMRQE